jgi:predicted dehydrogenase
MRFGLIGTGFWARVTHGAALRDHPRAELVGVWGRNSEKAAELAEHLGSRPYADFEALLADVDTVAIALPPHIQADLAARAAERGKHLLLDKPLALGLPAADRVVQAVERSGVRAAVFFTNRYVDEVDAWLAGLPDHDWFAARVRMHGSIYEPGSPYAGSRWRQQHGALWDIVPHALSIVLPVLGPVERVIAQHGPADAVDVGLTHAGGATSLISVSLDAPPGARGTEWQFLHAAGAHAMPQPDRRADAIFARCIDDLLGAVENGGPTRCDVPFAREVVRLIVEAQAALRLPGTG